MDRAPLLVYLPWAGVVVLVLGAGLWHGVLRRRYRPRVVERFAAAAGLTLTPELTAEVTRRLVRRARCDLAGRVIGVAVFAALKAPFGIFGGALVGMAAGRVAAQVAEARRAVSGGARVTHLVAPRLTDYVHPLSAICAHAVVLLPLPPAVVWLVELRRITPSAEGYAGAHDRTAPALLAATCVVTLCAEAAAQLTLRLRRVAASTDELALDDALRVTTLRDLALLPQVVALYATVAFDAVLSNLPLGPAGRLWWAVPFWVAVALALVGLGTERFAPRRWRRRLYPAASPR
jgi:hypothetical protein